MADAAARLNRLVIKELLAAGVPAITCSPFASAECQDGQLLKMSTSSIVSAFRAGLVPVVHGDVAFDRIRGGTIVSTEEVMMYLVELFRPSWLLLAGDTAGVLDQRGKVLPEITPDTLATVQAVLGESAGTDVTGGMASKVAGMVALCRTHPGLGVRIFSGRDPRRLTTLLLGGAQETGTVIHEPVRS